MEATITSYDSEKNIKRLLAGEIGTSRYKVEAMTLEVRVKGTIFPAQYALITDTPEEFKKLWELIGKALANAGMIPTWQTDDDLDAMAEMFAKGAWKDRGCCAHRTGYMPRWECRREGIMHRCTKGECLRTNPAAVGLVARYEYDPDYAVPPGETLAEVIEDRGMTQHDLAIAMCLTDEYIVEIIAGEQSITQDIATGLETVTGVPARMWMALEKQYRELL